MKRLDIEILGLCETRWADSGDFWSDDFKVICTNSTRRQAELFLTKSGIQELKMW
ncbi:Hypothetical protein CINCED_3A021065 [Cinara cedri]|uniref:Uncharacterized protein n=1 Tax=Cinara cedri TaxID=506608 RepID=A0A5E4MA70_9HEMI|nr:Hypothetical protein CINCED_3A021065 [Cinara cedri]